MQNRKRDTDLQNSLSDSAGEGEGGMFQENSIETCILSRVKQITSPGETSAWTWCTGKTQRDRMEREVGGGIGMENTCKPMAVSLKKKKKHFTGVITYTKSNKILCWPLCLFSVCCSHRLKIVCHIEKEAKIINCSTRTNTLQHHLYVESNEYNKFVNKTEMKNTHIESILI